MVHMYSYSHSHGFGVCVYLCDGMWFSIHLLRFEVWLLHTVCIYLQCDVYVKWVLNYSASLYVCFHAKIPGCIYIHVYIYIRTYGSTKPNQTK